MVFSIKSFTASSRESVIEVLAALDRIAINEHVAVDKLEKLLANPSSFKKSCSKAAESCDNSSNF